MFTKIYNSSFNKIYRNNYNKNYIYHALITQHNMSFGKYNYAIVRNIDPKIITNGLSILPNNSLTINLNKAKTQHDNLINIMKSLHLDVHMLDSNGYPDSVFIEDTCVIIDDIGLEIYK